MQIKPILAVITALACLLLECTAIAADPRAMTEDTKFGEETMSKNGKRAITASVRNTRPAIDRHKDARHCLDGGKNKAIIECAQRYR